jgi:hypothetical protein
MFHVNSKTYVTFNNVHDFFSMHEFLDMVILMRFPPSKWSAMNDKLVNPNIILTIKLFSQMDIIHCLQKFEVCMFITTRTIFIPNNHLWKNTCVFCICASNFLTFNENKFESRWVGSFPHFKHDPNVCLCIWNQICFLYILKAHFVFINMIYFHK